VASKIFEENWGGAQSIKPNEVLEITIGDSADASSKATVKYYGPRGRGVSTTVLKTQLEHVKIGQMMPDDLL